ncbi:MAG: carbohydrate-binding family 9-like protein [Phycisphaeraceae bacterium]
MTTTTPVTYTIAPATPATPSAPVPGEWDDATWGGVKPLTVGEFHRRSSDHQPLVQAKVLYDDAALYVFFRVEDRYVLSKRTELHDMVCKDSCVEFFVRPREDAGYFNVEINAGGTMLLYYCASWGGKDDRDRRPVEPERAALVEIHPSLPRTVEPEITEPVTWTLQYRLPLALFEPELGPLGPLAGQRWTANFYKCADESSHPHWASWSSVGERLSFHQPDRFGVIEFGA